MVKYPVGEQSFEALRKGGFLYVDKTPFIDKIVNGSQYYFLGRPRRFGKSLFLSTMKCFFEGKRLTWNTPAKRCAQENRQAHWPTSPPQQTIPYMHSPAHSGTTADGFERVFATNHIGHFLLVNLLLPYMSESGRIINVTSSYDVDTVGRFLNLNAIHVVEFLRRRRWKRLPLPHRNRQRRKCFSPRSAICSQRRINNPE